MKNEKFFNLRESVREWRKFNEEYKSGPSARILACLDVRSDESGALVVTKGDAYNILDESEKIRNLGDPLEMAAEYSDDGADEITFLNIASGLSLAPIVNSPLIQLLKSTAQRVFVPLTIGGGIRSYTDSNGKFTDALEIADEYFRAGADKISIGSDSVTAAEEFFANGRRPSGNSSIEKISHRYGAQAVVVSVDPRRVYVDSPTETRHRAIPTTSKVKNHDSKPFVWFQCTVKGGRETRDLDVFELIEAVQALGAGELLLNCVDFDGQKSGFDLELLAAVTEFARIPVIASSGAGNSQHFVEVFQRTRASAALAAGIFHRKEVKIQEVKRVCKENQIKIRE